MTKIKLLFSSLDIIPLCGTGGVLWKCVFVRTCSVPAHSTGSVPTFINSFLLKGANSSLNDKKIALSQWSAVSLGYWLQSNLGFIMAFQIV